MTTETPTKVKRARAPKDPNKVTLKKADADLLPCLGHGRRFRVEGSCSVAAGILALHPTPATSPVLVAPDAPVPGVRGWYSVTHVPTGLCLRPAIEGAARSRLYVAAIIRLVAEAGLSWDAFISDATRHHFRVLDEQAYAHAEALSIKSASEDDDAAREKQGEAGPS